MYRYIYISLYLYMCVRVCVRVCVQPPKQLKVSSPVREMRRVCN